METFEKCLNCKADIYKHSIDKHYEDMHEHIHRHDLPVEWKEKPHRTMAAEYVDRDRTVHYSVTKLRCRCGHEAVR